MSKTRKHYSPAFIPVGYAGLLPWPSPDEKSSLATDQLPPSYLNESSTFTR